MESRSGFNNSMEFVNEFIGKGLLRVTKNYFIILSILGVFLVAYGFYEYYVH